MSYKLESNAISYGQGHTTMPMPYAPEKARTHEPIPEDGTLVGASPTRSLSLVDSQQHLASNTPTPPKAQPGAGTAVSTLAVLTFVVALNSTCLAVALSVCRLSLDS